MNATQPVRGNEKAVPAVEPKAREDRRSFIKTATAFLTGAAAVPLSGSGLALAQGGGGGLGVREQFQLIRRHENEHVAFLLQGLGTAARPKPTFRNLALNDVNTFLNVSASLESIGTAAYLGAAPYINSQLILAQAGSIATIEARHTGFIMSFLGVPMTQSIFGAEQSFEMPLYPADVRNLGDPFIASLNGGPPISYDGVVTDANDIAILNFALALEFLEQEFYNINVPRFFP